MNLRDYLIISDRTVHRNGCQRGTLTFRLRVWSTMHSTNRINPRILYTRNVVNGDIHLLKGICNIDFKTLFKSHYCI